MERGRDSGTGWETGGTGRDFAGRNLHSRYNPQAEAERYIDALALPGGLRYFILVEPGLGYTIPVLARRFPQARFFVLHAEDPRPFRPVYRETERVSVWSPESGIGPENFLEREIPDTRASGLRILEWRPSLNYYGERYLKLLSAAAEFVRRSDANSRTARSFGRRWFRNFLRNQRLLGSFPVFAELSLPALIAGAGPSLEEAIPQIRAMGEGSCFVIAPSSSVMALAAGGLTPDLILSTDGGIWALLHLYECLRRGTGGPGGTPVIAASLGAALPSQCGAFPLLPLSDGSLWQRLVLETLGIPHLALAQRGTVTASALDLAFALGAKEACIAGMDLGLRDIRSHARPYSFDRLRAEGACRFRPEYSQAFTRSFGINGGGSHRIYAAWFKERLQSWKGRLYTLGNNNPVFQELKVWGDRPERPGQGRPGLRIVTRPVPDKPVRIAVNRLLAALDDPQSAGLLYRELAPLLLPDFSPDSGPGLPPRDHDGIRALAAEIAKLARPYLERVHG
ncbi:MAG: DUF115 domain-containing protein [Treponema sp.]|jgi:hypothetical protein|nr:DUF115 domain-containing protein [Treponema sp.]